MDTHPAPNPDPGKARKLLLITVIAFGTVGLLVRGIPLPSAEIALFRAVIALVVLGLYLLISGKHRLLIEHKKQLWKFLLSGAVMAFNWILLFEAYKHTSIALATLAYYLAPTLMIVFGMVLLKESLTRKQVFCFALSTLGLVLMLGVSFGNSSDVKGVLLGLASAVLYATVITINRLSGQIDGLVRATLQFVGASIVMVPTILLGEGFHVQSLDVSGWVSLIILGVFHTGLCYALYFISIVRLKGQQVAILSYLDPLVAVLLSVLLLKESVTFWQLVGGIVMLAAAFFNEINPKPRIMEKRV